MRPIKELKYEFRLGKIICHCGGKTNKQTIRGQGNKLKKHIRSIGRDANKKRKELSSQKTLENY